jgi:hypothetical protein
VAEVRNAELRKSETRKLPAVVEVLVAMRERLWVDTARKAIWIAALSGFDTGVRPSNVRLKEGKSAVDHCILAGDLVFTVATTMGVRRLQGGEAIHKELEDGYLESIQRVSDVDISVVTTKSTNKSSAGRVVYRVSRGNAYESSAVDDFSVFQVLSGVKSTDKFCTRYSPSKRGESRLVRLSRTRI